MANSGKSIPDRRTPSFPFPDPIHVTLGALELETLADAQNELVSGFRTAGNHETADVLEARAHELRRFATVARSE